MNTESVVRAVGRPSLYSEEMQTKADEYILRHEDQGDVIPSHAGLCCWLGVVKSTIYLWAKSYPEFSDTLEAILVKQESITVNKGLKGEFNSTISKLVLANHGYSDKQEIDHMSSDSSMTPKGLALGDFYASHGKKESSE